MSKIKDLRIFKLQTMIFGHVFLFLFVLRKKQFVKGFLDDRHQKGGAFTRFSCFGVAELKKV